MFSGGTGSFLPKLNCPQMPHTRSPDWGDAHWLPGSGRRGIHIQKISPNEFRSASFSLAFVGILQCVPRTAFERSSPRKWDAILSICSARRNFTTSSGKAGVRTEQYPQAKPSNVHALPTTKGLSASLDKLLTIWNSG